MNTATSSFILSPFNFHDHDTSIESSNAVLLSIPEKDGDIWPADENGVQAGYCIPSQPPVLEYRGEVSFDLNGGPMS